MAQHLRGLGCPPLHLALPWIMTAFAGHLAVGEVLLLWDRILGFDSLLPLPLLAVAVVAFRRQVSLALCLCIMQQYGIEVNHVLLAHIEETKRKHYARRRGSREAHG